MEYAEILRPYVAHTSQVLNDALRAGKSILLEGQLGALKDTDHGISDGIIVDTPQATVHRCWTPTICS